MTINLKIPDIRELKPRITVFGVGGAGGNAVNNMINSHLEGCEFLVCNTDAQALENNNSTHKIQLGVNVTRGLGAGANPEIGRAAAEESIDEIMAILEGSNMVFVTAGMGGGTGTGAAPVIAQMAREAGILTVGVVTKPFHFEGSHRMKLAEAGISELQKHVDTLIIIPNQNLFRIANEKTTFSDAFRMADEVLQSGVRGVTDLMVMPGLINLDFADIRAVMAEMGKAMMGTGEATGERRAVEAAESAISNPLLDDISMKGARGVLINITGGLDMTLFEVDEAANRIRDEVDPDANIIFGSTFDAALEGRMRVSVVATGIEVDASTQPKPLPVSAQVSEAARRPAARVSAKPAIQPSMGYDRVSAAPRAELSAPIPRDFSGGLPPSILPNHSHGAMMQPTASAAKPAMAQREMEYAAEPQMTVGHASSATYATAATARKLDDEALVLDDVHTKPEQTQTIQRHTAQPGQPRAQRHGDSFIPPKPVDPRTAAASGDLFGEKSVAAAPRAPQAAEKPVKKSPSLFERFTMQRLEEPQVSIQARPEAPSPRLSVEEGGKKDEDELDIPAFLRRQAN
ncbi:MAG: cell division protein FtsZ [Hyphomicrobiales bacterium]|nr:cell division protein FtsZ [Hyphomicrobiales bacterium]